MDFIPSRKLGTLIGGLLLVILFGSVVLSVVQLATAPISAWIILWVALPILMVPLILLLIYRLYGLLTSRYRLDRDGFYLTWGLISEQVPLTSIDDLWLGREAAKSLHPGRGLWWPGCVVGRRKIESVGEVEFFATSYSIGMVLIRTDDRILAISPPDPEAFQQTFVDATRLGSLEPISAGSQRPDFILSHLWNDLAARGLVLLGLVLPLLLLAYLALQATSLPIQVPFGFDPSGQPDTLAPPGRLLLLPMVGEFCWLMDFLVGAWIYRDSENRPISYTLWTIAVLVGVLLWGAALHLLAAA